MWEYKIYQKSIDENWPSMAQKLNILGQDGWEVISVDAVITTGSPNQFYQGQSIVYHMKRKVRAKRVAV